MISAFKTSAIALSVLLSGPFAATAQELEDGTILAVPYATDADAKVTAYMLAMGEGVLTEDQSGVLKSIAFQKAVAIICPGFTLDDAKMATELAKAAPSPEQIEAMTDEQGFTQHSITMLVLGGYLGSQLKSAVADEPAFCDHAEAERGDGTAAHIVWAPKS